MQVDGIAIFSKIPLQQTTLQSSNTNDSKNLRVNLTIHWSNWSLCCACKNM